MRFPEEAKGGRLKYDVIQTIKPVKDENNKTVIDGNTMKPVMKKTTQTILKVKNFDPKYEPKKFGAPRP
jgi:hypothetical protein